MDQRTFRTLGDWQLVVLLSTALTVTLSCCSPSTKDLENEALMQACDSLNSKADLDYRSGVRHYTELGMFENSDFEQFYTGYMMEKYDINIIYSCTGDFPEMCYWNTMNYKIEEEFGDSVILKSRSAARMVFDTIRAKN